MNTSRVGRRQVLSAGAGLLAASFGRSAHGESLPVVRVGHLTDMSGPYSPTSGPTSVACARQAIEDFGPARHGFSVELIPADHQNNPDASSSIVREWFDRSDVDVVMEVNNSAIALAVTTIAQAKDKLHLNTGAVSADLTGPRCSPNLIHWTYDSWMLTHSASTIVQQGGDTWFIIAPDYAFGAAMTRDTTHFVEQSGGKVVGVARHPFPGITDFSAYLLQAQASGAKVIGFANGGNDIVNCVKQAREFGLPQQGIRLMALAGQTTDVHAIGLESAEGLIITGAFYWDLNDRTRAFTARVLPKTPDNYPNMLHAGTYSALTHYMKAVAAMGPQAAKASGRAAVEQMKRMPTDDDCLGQGLIRADGRKIHPVYLLQVKKPTESRRDWDLCNVIATTPAEQAFRPISEGGCPFVKA